MPRVREAVRRWGSQWRVLLSLLVLSGRVWVGVLATAGTVAVCEVRGCHNLERVASLLRLHFLRFPREEEGEIVKLWHSNFARSATSKAEWSCVHTRRV